MSYLFTATESISIYIYILPFQGEDKNTQGKVLSSRRDAVKPGRPGAAR